jgi:hypothetical protein
VHNSQKSKKTQIEKNRFGRADARHFVSLAFGSPFPDRPSEPKNKISGKLPKRTR